MNPFLLLAMILIALVVGVLVFLDLDHKLEKRQEAENGRLIVIEGTESVGKARLIRLMKSMMPEDWFYSKEPYIIDKPLREWTSSDFQADRETHVQQKILPLLAQNKTLILNRYWFSACVYDGYASEPYLNTWPEPDLVIWLDKTPDQEQTEISGRTIPELSRLGLNYQTLFKRLQEDYYLPVIRVNVAHKTEEEIFFEVCQEMKKVLSFEDPFKELQRSIDSVLSDDHSFDTEESSKNDFNFSRQ